MEAVEGSANDGTATGSKRRYEFLSECGFARSIRPINGDANGMRLFDPNDSTSEAIYELRTFHALSLLLAGIIRLS
jgi:hypothetical protein